MSAASALAWTVFSGNALAAESADVAPEAKEEQTSFWARDTMLGDMDGIRPWLGKYGVTFQLTETSAYLANVRGGLDRGDAYDGLTTATLSVDTEKAFGLRGGQFNISALQIHGTNLSTRKLGTLDTASGIEAENTNARGNCGISSRFWISVST